MTLGRAFAQTISMEEISNQLQDMCVDDFDGTNNSNNNNTGDNEQKMTTNDCSMGPGEHYHNDRPELIESEHLGDSLVMDQDDPHDTVGPNQGAGEEEEVSNILVVTNIDSRLFVDHNLKQQFESIFIAYDPNVTFRYLKSFRRVRLDFTTPEQAEAARFRYNSLDSNATSKCYAIQLIKSSQGSNSSHLLPPKPTRQFLISPPASPPVGWEPVTESSPCIDIQLLSALANIVPGKAHLIHEATESQPGIVVEVCDDLRMQAERFDELTPIKQTPRIAPTARPF